MALLWQMGADRENAAIRRYLALNFHELFRRAGVPRVQFGTQQFHGPCWCALNLPRRVVFDDDAYGDVDILAGPVEPAFSDEEFTEVLRAERARLGPKANEGWVLELALMTLLPTKGVVWPPRDRTVVALEAKASWFSHEAHHRARPGAKNAPRDGWKATHINEQGRILGQLTYLAEKGVDAVSFLHLGTTKPRDVLPGHPWFVAGHDWHIAEECLSRVFDAEGTPFGYFVSVIGAVEGKAEDWAGAGGVLRVIHEPQLQRRAEQSWKDAFFEKLAGLPAPTSLSPIIGCTPDSQLRWEAGTHEALMSSEEGG